MTLVPDGTFRTRVKGDDTRPPVWWDIWEYAPGQENVVPSKRERVYLGRSERLRRPRWHRFHPASGEWPRDICGWIEGIRWLQEVYRSHHPALDTGK